MKKRRRNSADWAQAAAADICIRIMLADQEGKSLGDVYDEIFKAYHLCEDPFTHCPCSEFDWASSCEEYIRQSRHEQ